MVQSAIADVIGPAIPAENPVRALDKEILLCADFVQQWVVPRFRRQRRNQSIGAMPRPLALIFVLQPILHRSNQLRIPFFAQRRFDPSCQCFAILRHSQVHAESVFGIVLEQREAPGRTFPLPVRRIRDRGRAAGPGRGTTGGVGNHHPVSDQLGDQFGVRGLATTGAGAGEFLQWFGKLTAFYGQFLLGRNLFDRNRAGILPEFFQRITLFRQRRHHQRFLFGRAGIDAVAATGTIERGNRQMELQVR